MKLGMKMRFTDGNLVQPLYCVNIGRYLFHKKPLIGLWEKIRNQSRVRVLLKIAHHNSWKDHAR